MKPAKYNQNIKKYIPKYEEMQAVIVKMFPFAKEAPIQILELAIGTGNLAFKLLKRFSSARLVGVDHDLEMLKLASRKLQKFSPRFTLVEENISNISPKNNQYDAVVSLLSVHHLANPQKKALFKRLYCALRPKGIFINGDFVISKSETINIKSAQMEKEFMLARGLKEEGLLTLKGKIGAEDDIPTLVENQLEWLRESGFDEAECLWRYFHYAICVGLKRG